MKYMDTNHVSTKIVRPVTPVDVVSTKRKALPPEVLEAFNEMITKYYLDGTAKFEQDEVVALIEEKLLTVSRQEIVGNKWLDVKDIYQGAGWGVFHAKPSYNDTHKATFTFRKVE